jgi:hypothetical protein
MIMMNGKQCAAAAAPHPTVHPRKVGPSVTVADIIVVVVVVAGVVEAMDVGDTRPSVSDL